MASVDSKPLKNPISYPIVGWLAIITIVVIAVHYIIYIGKINDDRACRGQYNADVIKVIEATHNLNKEAFDSQNRLDNGFRDITLHKPAYSLAIQNEKLKALFAVHDAEQTTLDAKFKDNQFPVFPKCFDELAPSPTPAP
jgi:hypothetical protein